MAISKLEFLKHSDLPKAGSGYGRFNNGYRYQNSGKYISDDLVARYNYVSEKINLKSGPKVLTCSTVMYSSCFAEHYLSGEVLKHISTLQRLISVRLRITTLGYMTFFDSKLSCIKTRFYFVNYDVLNEETSLSGSISKQEFEKLNVDFDSKLNAYPNLFSDSTMVRQEPSGVVDFSIPENPFEEETLDNKVFHFTSLLADPIYKAAVLRSIKGLDAKRAETLLAALNDLIEFTPESGIEPLTLPKKFSGPVSVGGSRKGVNQEDAEDGEKLFTM